MNGSFEAWYRDEHRQVLASCVALCGDLGVATDATDEAFSRALGRWERVSAMPSPGAWVCIGIAAAYRDLPTGPCEPEYVIPSEWQIALPNGATATAANHDASALPFPGLVTCRGQLGPANPVQLASG